MRSLRQLARPLAVRLSDWTTRATSIARRYWRVAFWRVALVVVLLIAGPILIGVFALSQESPERKEPASVGFVPPLGGKPGRGFTVGLVARLRSCEEPLDVTVVAAGTAEYWLDNAAALRGRVAFQLALPGVVGEVELRPGTTATDVVDPDTTELRRNDPPLLLPGDFRRTRTRRTGDLLIVGGTIRDWPKTLVPVIADFRADWIEERSLGTCFIHLPAIAGDLSILSAQRALGNARKVDSLIVGPNDLTVDSRDLGLGARYRPGLEVVYGSATVRVDNGSIDTDDSLPPPSESVNGNPTWTCMGRARSTKLLGDKPSGPAVEDEDYVLLGPDPLGSAGALSTPALRAGPAGDCSAVVAANEASSEWKRDLVLLLIGAVVSLGITILVELALGMRGSEQLKP